MKFIRIAYHTEEFRKCPPPDFGIRLKEHEIWLKEQIKSGKLICEYVLAGNAGPVRERNIGIWEFETAEEIEHHIWDDPIGDSFIWEVYPAVDVFEHMKCVYPKFGIEVTDQ